MIQINNKKHVFSFLFFLTAAVLTPQQAAVAVINPFPPGPTK